MKWGLLGIAAACMAGGLWLGLGEALSRRTLRDVAQATRKLGDYYRGLKPGQQWTPRELHQQGFRWTDHQVSGGHIYEVVNPPGVSRLTITANQATETISALNYLPD